MKRILAVVLTAAVTVIGAPLIALSAVTAALVFVASPARAQTPSITEKLNAYVGCINRLSERSYQSRSRYFSWAAKSGPTGRERIIYGTYTIYDTTDCRNKVEAANAMEPHDAELEAAATTYAKAVGKLETLLKEADDYYTQQDYKDDRMAKGKALHPMLVAAWDAFEGADKKLRRGVEAINDRRALEKLAAIEQSDGRNERYHVEAVMIRAKRVLRFEGADKPDLAEITEAIADYEATLKGAEPFASSAGGAKIGSFFMSNAKSFLATAKFLMRRLRDHVPYSTGDKMMLNAGSGWMVEGSPQRLMRDYNQLVDAYNRGARI
ncbi:MAG TPA: YiiG family protein [Pseudolabrys sp.]|nr:YiiG family protein [Pseudolabrys sp.]